MTRQSSLTSFSISEANAEGDSDSSSDYSPPIAKAPSSGARSQKIDSPFIVKRKDASKWSPQESQASKSTSRLLTLPVEVYHGEVDSEDDFHKSTPCFAFEQELLFA